MNQLRLTVSYQPKQFIHGCLNWQQNLGIDMTNNVVLRLRDDYGVIGQLCVQYGEEALTGLTEAWIFCFAIHPEMRGNGIGTDFLQLAERWINKNLRPDYIKLHAQKEFEDILIPFYMNRGYKFLARDPKCRNEAILVKAPSKIYN